MALNREDFPGLTDEAWAEINAEIDRERTKASSTARKNAKTEMQGDIQAQIDAALEAERKRLEMTEQEKLADDRKKLQEEKAQISAEKKTLKATKQLVAAGYADEAIEQLLPMFAGLGDDVFETALTSFITVNENVIKNKVDSVKQELLGNVTPPKVTPNSPTTAEAAAAETFSKAKGIEDVAAGLDLLLQGH